MFNLVVSNSIKKNKRVAYRAVIIVVLTVLGIGWGQAECSTQNDVIKGMRIEDVRVVNDDCIHLSTTGAIFKINKSSGTMEIYQRIGKKRKLAEVSLSDKFISVLKKEPHNEGFEYAWGDKDKTASIVISGDSVVRFYNVKKIKIELFFTPIHHKINSLNRGLIALDNEGGFAIMPPDKITSTDYSVTIEKKEWLLDSDSNMSVLFLGVCPPREFDWERSKWPVIHYSSHIQRYPSDEQIKEYSKFAKVLEMHQWVWKNRYVNKKDCSKEPYNNCDGDNTPLWRDDASWPVNNRWIADDEKELKRVVTTAHANGMLVAVYFNGLKMDCHSILPEALRLKNKYNIDGIYLDGLLNCSNRGPLDAYLTARELRKLFGDDGWINYHNTHKGYFSPFIQTYMDFVTTGEHNKFDRYTSTTFNISNAIGGYWPEIPFFWLNDSKNIKDARSYLKDLVDISLKYHNRLLFLTGEQGQWRFWRLYFTPSEMQFMKDYYLNRISFN
jgi:hypothetical protein